MVESRLPLPDDASASPALAAEYAAARVREGRGMAILRSMGPRAEVVRAFVQLADAVLYGPAALGRRERELLALATSQANATAYSTAVHDGLLQEAGGADGSARDAGLVAFAQRLTRAPAEAPAAVAALRAYLTDDEVHDAVATVALLNFANRMAAATAITPGDDLL